MKRYKRNNDRIWQDSYVRDLYFGGVLFTELLQECYELGTNIPLWLAFAQQEHV